MENNFYLNKFVNEILDLPENRENLRRLGCLTQDCLYYFGQGNRADKYLWNRTAQEHIKKMKEIVDSLPFDIDWCTPRDVMLFEECFYTEEDTICLCQDAKVKLWDYLPDEIVGKVNNGLFNLSATTLQVSQHFPPPTAKMTSACFTVLFSVNIATFS